MFKHLNSSTFQRVCLNDLNLLLAFERCNLTDSIGLLAEFGELGQDGVGLVLRDDEDHADAVIKRPVEFVVNESAGVAQKLVLNGNEVVVAGIFAMTLIDQVPLSINIYRPYENRDTIERLMAEQRRFVGQLLKRNQTLQSDVTPNRAKRPVPIETPGPPQAKPR